MKPKSRRDIEIEIRADADERVRRMMALPKDLFTRDPFEPVAETILDIMKGCPAASFWLIDEKTGLWPQFYRERFWALRTIRNHQPWADRLFDGLTS